MTTLYKYGFLFLALVILGSIKVEAQVEVKTKTLQELRHLEERNIELDEIEPLLVPEIGQVNFAFLSEYNGATNMRLMKKMHEISVSKKFSFNVEEKYADINLRIIGKLHEGTLMIRVSKPNKQILKEMKFVAGKEQNWQQSFCLEENEGNGFVGKWTVELSCNQASGYYQFVSQSR